MVGLNFGLVVLSGGMVLDELGFISYWIGYGGFSCNLGLLKARGTRKECCDWFGCKGGSRVEVWWSVVLVFYHIRTVFGFFRVGNSVSTILDSERDILGPIGRAGIRLEQILGLKGYHLSLFLLCLA